MPSGAKKDLEPYRDDILQRTAAGESCEQIATALRANGFDVSAKTVSRYRVNWGIRQRSEPSTKGRHCMSIAACVFVSSWRNLYFCPINEY